jgi:hypothetical protein
VWGARGEHSYAEIRGVDRRCDRTGRGDAGCDRNSPSVRIGDLAAGPHDAGTHPGGRERTPGRGVDRDRTPGDPEPEPPIVDAGAPAR